MQNAVNSCKNAIIFLHKFPEITIFPPPTDFPSEQSRRKVPKSCATAASWTNFHLNCT